MKGIYPSLKLVTETHGFLIVFDLTNRHSFESITKWMNSIRNAMTDPMDVILVGAKCDLKNLFARRGRSESKRIPDPYFETSAKEDINIDEAFSELTKMIDLILQRREANKASEPKEDARTDVTMASKSDQKKNLCMIS